MLDQSIPVAYALVMGDSINKTYPVQTSLRLTQDQHTALTRIARERGTNVRALVRTLVDDYVRANSYLRGFDPTLQHDLERVARAMNTTPQARLTTYATAGVISDLARLDCLDPDTTQED